MDYEKKYKEALERANKYNFDGAKQVVKDLVFYIFPELKESEDEKIRKELIELISCMHDADPRKKGWIAWLEKQESVEEIVSRCKTSWYNEGKIQGHIEGLSDEEKYQQGWHDALEKQGEQKGYTFKSIPRLLDMIEPSDKANAYCQKLIDTLAKEGYDTDAKIVEEVLKGWNGEDVPMAVMDEQKPFDYENANIQQKDFAPKEDAPRYSIGDVLCDKSCTTLNKDTQPNFEIVDIRNGMYICDKGSFPISQQDEYELVAKKIEQKPAEWSEEDEH